MLFFTAASVLEANMYSNTTHARTHAHNDLSYQVLQAGSKKKTLHWREGKLNYIQSTVAWRAVNAICSANLRLP